MVDQDFINLGVTLGAMVVSVKYLRDRISSIERKLNNGITDKLNELVTSAAVRGEVLDRVEAEVAKLTSACPAVHMDVAILKQEMDVAILKQEHERR